MRPPSEAGRIGNCARGQSGSFSHLTETANSQEKRGFSRPRRLAPRCFAMCIVGLTRLRPGVHQPDPPGLIHDDPRLLPPLARVVLFVWLSLICAMGAVDPTADPHSCCYPQVATAGLVCSRTQRQRRAGEF